MNPIVIESRLILLTVCHKRKMTENQQHKRWAFLLLVFALLLASGCGDKEPTNAGKRPPVDQKTGAQNTLRIVFKWPGDDFASRQDLAIRDKIGELIRKRGVGKIIRVGTGMGWMDILIEVKEKDIAIPKIKSIIKETGHELNFTIEDLRRTS
jgi:hypothetical protein